MMNKVISRCPKPGFAYSLYIDSGDDKCGKQNFAYFEHNI